MKNFQCFKPTNSQHTLNFIHYRHSIFLHSLTVESRPKRHALPCPAPFVESSHFTSLKGAEVREGWTLQRPPPWASGALAIDSQDSKKEHIQTPTRLTSAATPGRTSKNFRSPCPKLVLKGCGLTENPMHTWASVKLHGPPRTSARPLKGNDTSLN